MQLLNQVIPALQLRHQLCNLVLLALKFEFHLPIIVPIVCCFPVCQGHSDTALLLIEKRLHVLAVVSVKAALPPLVIGKLRPVFKALIKFIITFHPPQVDLLLTFFLRFPAGWIFLSDALLTLSSAFLLG